MPSDPSTFGRAISNARKAKGWALKDLAAKVLREDEVAISPQYLNDIEHDRRSPSSDRMVQYLRLPWISTATGSITSPADFPKTFAARSFPRNKSLMRWWPFAAALKLKGVAKW